jgi:diguanylate cyclase (GGDEF)-like protein
MNASDSDRAPAAAGMFAAGGLLGALALAVPGWESRNRPGLWLMVGMVLLVAPGLALLGRLSLAYAHALVAAGTMAVSVVEVLNGGGAATATSGVLYLLVAVYACAMFRPTAAALHLLLMAVGQSAALMVLGEAAQAPAQVVLTVGAAAATGILVGYLVGQVRRLAASDPLTGLPNRRAADEALARALADAQRSGAPLCVAVLDLDDFKELNDTRGHATGDRVLQAAARQWAAQLRRGDLLARVGGDEFLVVLADCTPGAAAEIAGRLGRATPLQVRCSIGLASWDGSESSLSLVERADRALYEAKRGGDGGVAVSAQG